MKFESLTFEFHGVFCLEAQFLDVFPCSVCCFHQAVPPFALYAPNPLTEFAMSCSAARCARRTRRHFGLQRFAQRLRQSYLNETTGFLLLRESLWRY